MVILDKIMKITMSKENLTEIFESALESDLNTVAPNYNKDLLSPEEKRKIIKKIANDIETTEEDTLIGTILLMLKGAASDGTPQTLSINLRNGKTIAKRDVAAAYLSVTGNQFIRRLAESMAVEIGTFAEHKKLTGELAQRINTLLKAETGEILTEKEMAWCSSFSQNLPDLANKSSERLVRLLAEDYKTRFENKKKLFNKDRSNEGGRTNKKRRKHLLD